MKKVITFGAVIALCLSMISINANAYNRVIRTDQSSVETSYGTLTSYLSCLQEVGYPTGYREFDITSMVEKTAPKLWFDIEAIPYPTGGNPVDKYSSWGYNVKGWGGYLESHHWGEPTRKVSVYGCSEVRNASDTYARVTYTGLTNV